MNLKKLVIGISLVSLVLVTLVTYTTSAHADDRPNHEISNNNSHSNGGNFNLDKQLSKSACGSNLKNPIIDVKQKVQNDVDSGFGGNNWAFDYYTRHIQVWKTTGALVVADGEEGTTYCAIVTYDGKFYAVPGQQGPGGTGDLINTSTDAPVNGSMSGGYRDLITGVLRTTLSNGWPTNGNVGTTNYKCDISGSACVIPSWKEIYFSSFSVTDEPWWGWKYNGGSHGTWTNAIDVSQSASGNIL